MPTLRTWLDRLRPSAHRSIATAGKWARHVGARARVVSQRVWTHARAADRRYVLGGIGLVTALVLIVVIDTISGSPGADEIRAMGHMPTATVLFDRHDKAAFTVFEERRHEVPLAAISPNVINAVLAIEDQRFYKHRGIDLWRIAGSVWANIRSGEFDQGGSTITQQLARLSFLTPDKKVRRKLKEIYLALRMEQIYSKDEILEMYLNKVYFGSGLHGVEAAARGYFDKSATDLAIDEASLVAGLIQAPSAYDPGQHPERALKRRAVVLDQMAGAGMIDAEAARQMAATPLALIDDEDGAGAWFKQAVTRELVALFGWERVSESGLRVYTTLDPLAQEAAEKALAEGLTRIEKSSRFRHPRRDEMAKPQRGTAPEYLQGALVSIDPASGEVRALVGGRDFADSQFDRVSQASRQSGSAFKPFVYAAALELGYSPATLITGLDEPIATPEGPWLPADGHNVAEALTMRAALRTSSNRAAAQMLQTIGIQPAVAQARKFGLDAPPVPSLVLGSGEVTLMALTSAYGAFADAGTLRTPRLIRRVEDADGVVLMETHDAPVQVLSAETAYQMAAMLADVIDRGTGNPVRQAGFRQRAAGKTGTTNDYRDAWFVGFTPDLVTGVWVGFDQPKTIVPGGYASELAVPIWGTFMRDATAGAPGRWIDRPSNLVAVEICQDSGLLPTHACSRVRRVSSSGEESVGSTVAVEYFRRGKQPHQQCPLHDFSFFRASRTASFDAADFPPSALVGALASPADRPSGDAPGPAVAAGETAEPKSEEPKKRGFWSRVRRVFGDDGKQQQDRPAKNRNR